MYNITVDAIHGTNLQYLYINNNCIIKPGGQAFNLSFIGIGGNSYILNNSIDHTGGTYLWNLINGPQTVWLCNNLHEYGGLIGVVGMGITLHSSNNSSDLAAQVISTTNGAENYHLDPANTVNESGALTYAGYDIIGNITEDFEGEGRLATLGYISKGADQVPEFDPSYGEADSTPKRWRTRIVSGYFYGGNRQNYLYGRKETISIDECAETEFPLAAMPLPSGMVLTVDGVPTTDYFLRGENIVLQRPSMDTVHWQRFGWLGGGHIYNPLATVEATYNPLYWNDATNSFITGSTVVQEWALRDGETKFFLPSVARGDAPVIITDDFRDYGDGFTDMPQYKLTEVDDRQQIELDTETNLVLNPAFEIIDVPTGYVPGNQAWPDTVEAQAWDYLSVTGQVVLRQIPGYYGRNTIFMKDNDGIAQTVPTIPGHDVVLSAYARPCTLDNIAQVRMEVAYLPTTGTTYVNPSGTPIGSGDTVSSYSKNFNLTGDTWQRISIRMGSTDERFGIADVAIPDTIGSIRIRIKCTDDGAIVDAIMATHGVELENFGYISHASTIEYETNPTGIYQQIEQLDRFKVDRLDINPMNTPTAGGFIIAEELGPYTDYRLGRGYQTNWTEPAGTFAYGTPTGTPTPLEDYEILAIPTGETYLSSPAGVVLHSLHLGTIPTGHPLYAGAFTTDDGYSYPSGIQNEAWVKGLHPVYTNSMTIDLALNQGSGQTAWERVVKHYLKYYPYTDYSYSGVLFRPDDVERGVPRYGIGPNYSGMAQLMANLYSWVQVNYGTGQLLAIENGAGCFQSSFGDSLVDDLDYLVVGGAWVNEVHRATPLIERQARIAETDFVQIRLLERENLAAQILSMDFPNILGSQNIYGYTLLDVDQIARVYFEARSYGYNCYAGSAPTAWAVPEGTEALNTGIIFGRKDLSYAVTKGVGKVDKTSYFPLERREQNLPTTLQKEVLFPSRIGVRTTLPQYRDTSNLLHISIQNDDSRKLYIQIMDSNSNSLPGVPFTIRCTNGTVDGETNKVYRTNSYGTLVISYEISGQAAGVNKDTIDIFHILSVMKFSINVDVSD